MKILLILFYMIFCVFSKEIFIDDNSILSISYYNNQKYPVSISINNQKYRESSLIQNSNGIFSIELKPGYYNISSNLIDFKTKIEYGEIIKTKSKFNDKVINENKWTIIEKVEYYNKKKHKIKISSMINLKKINNNFGNYLITILLNDKIINAQFLNTSVYSFISNVIEVPKGYNTIVLKGSSFKNIWCSCPTAYDGFHFGRHLTVWKINNFNNKRITYTKNNNKIKKLNKITQIIPISIKINNKNKFIYQVNYYYIK